MSRDTPDSEQLNQGEERSNSEPVVLLEEIFPGTTNAYGTAFGGKILEMMDRAAGLAASKFARGNFVTASLDALEFRAPVRQGQIADVEAQVVYTSRHTCGLKVQVFAVDKAEWKRHACCKGIIFMVAIGPDGKPRKIPSLNPDTKEAKAEWHYAHEIHRAMLARRRVDGQSD